MAARAVIESMPKQPDIPTQETYYRLKPYKNVSAIKKYNKKFLFQTKKKNMVSLVYETCSYTQNMNIGSAPSALKQSMNSCTTELSRLLANFF